LRLDELLAVFTAFVEGLFLFAGARPFVKLGAGFDRLSPSGVGKFEAGFDRLSPNGVGESNANGVGGCVPPPDEQ
jgi:hypothetical protein